MKLQTFRLCILVLMLWLGGTAEPAGPTQAPAASAHGGGHPEATYRGGVVTPPVPKPRFTLKDTSGTPFDFWSETQGYVALLYFGYTHCLDACPEHVALVASALRTLPADVRKQVKVIFVTTDPKRDDPRSLRQWLDQFDKQFVGLTGDESAIQAAQSAVNLPIARGIPGYDHATFILAYTKDNLAHVIYPSGITQSDWIHDLSQLVAETWPGG